MSSTKKQTESVYARTGSSKQRVVDAIRNPCCHCGCRIPVAILLKVVVAFWLLSKPTQDSLLWSLQHEAGANKRKMWFIQGRVCQNTTQKVFTGLGLLNNFGVKGQLCKGLWNGFWKKNKPLLQDIMCAKLHGCTCWVSEKPGSVVARSPSRTLTYVPCVVLEESLLVINSTGICCLKMGLYQCKEQKPVGAYWFPNLIPTKDVHNILVWKGCPMIQKMPVTQFTAAAAQDLARHQRSRVLRWLHSWSICTSQLQSTCLRSDSTIKMLVSWWTLVQPTEQPWKSGYKTPCQIEDCIQVESKQCWWRTSTGTIGQTDRFPPSRPDSAALHEPRSSQAPNERASTWKLDKYVPHVPGIQQSCRWNTGITFYFL